MSGNECQWTNKFQLLWMNECQIIEWMPLTERMLNERMYACQVGKLWNNINARENDRMNIDERVNDWINVNEWLCVNEWTSMNE